MVGEVVAVVSDVTVGAVRSITTLRVAVAAAGPVLPARSATMAAFRSTVTVCVFAQPVKVSVKFEPLPASSDETQDVPTIVKSLVVSPTTCSLKTNEYVSAFALVGVVWPAVQLVTVGAVRSVTTVFALVFSDVGGAELPAASVAELAAKVTTTLVAVAHPVIVNEYGEAEPVRVPTAQLVPATVKSAATSPTRVSVEFTV